MTDARPAIILNALDREAAGDDLHGIVAALEIVAPTALARAAGLWVWKREWERKNPQSRRGGDRRSARFREGDQTAKFAVWLGEQGLKLADRTIRDDVALAETLGAPAIRELWGTHVDDNAVQLKRVARMTPDERALLFAQIKADKSASFDEWLRRARLREAEESDDRKFNSFTALWAGASAKLRRRILEHVGVPDEATDQVIALWKKRDKSNNTRTDKTAA